MKLRVLRGCLIACAVGIYTCTLADESLYEDGCPGVDSNVKCVDLGELRDTAVLSGSFASCSESDVPENVTLGESVGSAIAYEFQLTDSRDLKFEFDGVGKARIVKDGSNVRDIELRVSSVEGRFDSGQYLVVSHAPQCSNGPRDWRGRYRILIDLAGRDDVAVGETENTQASDPITVSKSEKTRLTATSNWSFWTYAWISTLGGVLFLLLLAAAG